MWITCGGIVPLSIKANQQIVFLSCSKVEGDTQAKGAQAKGGVKA